MKTKENIPSEQEWNNILNLMCSNLNTPIYIPKEFGEYFLEHFLNCSPPILYNDNYVLSSEPYTEDKFIGIFKNFNNYYGIITTRSNFQYYLNNKNNFENENRTRYYGLKIGDNVEVEFNGKKLFGIVNWFPNYDNNRIQLMIGNEINTWVAEHCKIID